MEKVTQVSEKFIVDSFTKDVGNPVSVNYAENTQDVQEFLNEMNEKGEKVITVGGNTGVVNATHAQNGEHMLSLERMNKILEMDEETLTLTVEAGTTLGQVKEYLEDTPYFYAPDPGSKDAAIGGNVATNAGGMRAVKYGVTRDNVRAMEVVLANGDLLNVGSLNMKSSTGYDMKNLFIGSEGTLGVITKVSLRLIPKPEVQRSQLLSFKTLEDLAPVIFQILSSPVKPTALEFFERDGIEKAEEKVGLKAPQMDGEWFILVTVDGNTIENVNNNLQILKELAEEHGAVQGLILSEQQDKDIWKLRDNLIIGIKGDSDMEPFDIVVPVNKITDAILQISNITKDMGLHDAFFGHAGDGNIHANLLRVDMTDSEWEQAVQAFNDRVYKLVIDMGGLPSAEHGIGLMKKKYLKMTFSTEEVAAMRSIKQALDPNNILNPEKVFDFK